MTGSCEHAESLDSSLWWLSSVRLSSSLRREFGEECVNRVNRVGGIAMRVSLRVSGYVSRGGEEYKVRYFQNSIFV